MISQSKSDLSKATSGTAKNAPRLFAKDEATIILAPMDGLTDFYVRNLLTAEGGYDLCMTEFLRVTNSVFPRKTFYSTCPEIDPKRELNGCTASGTPVILQLLGHDAGFVSANANKAIGLGVKGIDLNFGCPSNTVNRHGSGAVLLQYPEKLLALMQAVRQVVPPEISLSAKMRLGYEDSSLALENALALEEAGADFITVHARTKLDAYRPPAKWEEVTKLQARLSIPVVINGEVWNVDDYLSCRRISDCDDVMLGRGAFALPDLAKQIKDYLQLEAKAGDKSEMRSDTNLKSWNTVSQMLKRFHQLMVLDATVSERHISGRIKLWLKWLGASYDEAQIAFEQVKTNKDHQEIINTIIRV